MQSHSQPKTAAFDTKFFPQHIALLTVGDNMMPMGYWTVISKNPFRFLICMGVGNHSLTLLKKYKEAAFHFMPWSERERVVRAGYISGREGSKSARLGFNLVEPKILKNTKLVKGADSIFEMVLYRELMGLSREFIPLVMDVVAVHGELVPVQRSPILFFSQEDFATTGEKWQYKK